MTVTRVTIVGAAGWAGRRHVQAFAQAGAELLDLVDPSPQVREIAAEFGGRACESLGDADLAAADLIVVALPVSLQVPLVAGLLSDGHRVLQEKPLAVDPREAQLLADSSGAEDRLSVGYTLHAHPLLPRVRDWVAVHRPFSVAVRSVATKYEMLGWRSDPREGGALFVNAIHPIELLCSLLDETPRVHSARTNSEFFGSAAPEYVAASFAFASGLHADLQCYWAPWPNEFGLNQGDWDLCFDFVGADSRLVWRDDHLTIEGRGCPREQIDTDPTDLFHRQALNAIAFANGAPPMVGVQQAARATRVAHEILAAAQTHTSEEVAP